MERNAGYIVEERKINVKKMLLWAVSQWKVLLFVTVCFAIIVGVGKYAIDYQHHEANYEKALEEQENQIYTAEYWEKQLSDSEIEGVESTLYYYTKLHEAAEYLNNSVLMQLNPYAENRAEIVCYTEKAELTMEAVVSLIKDESFLAELNVLLGVEREKQYWQELITCDEQTGKIVITVIDKDRDACDKVAQYLIGKMKENITSEVFEGFYYTDTVIDMDLVQKLNVIYESNETNRTLYNNYHNELTTKQTGLYDVLIEMKENEWKGKTNDSDDEEVASEAVIELEPTLLSKKTVILGAGIGALIAVILLLLKYLFASQIHGEDEMMYLFGTRNIGTVQAGFGKGKKERIQKQIAWIVTNIRQICEMQKLKKIALAGSRIQDVSGEIIGLLTEEIRKAGIEVQVEGDIAHEAVSLSEVQKCRNVIFVEVDEKSDVADIAGELNVCIQNSLNVLGTILLK
jgi:hypothetical protein